ncbi:MAG: ATP-binding protein [Thermoanaerobaculia bacterium]|nr:ATP-binding protein [Thermoanaerobaculia bacterium]
MTRYFNTAGPCRSELHYMLPPEQRLPGVRRLIDQQLYFVVHAPRQSGKTTVFQSLAATLTTEGRYAVLHASCESAQAAGEDVDRGVNAILRAMERRALLLPAELRPPPVEEFLEIGAESRLTAFLTRWTRECLRPVVVFLDEIDAVLGTTLISVLRQLREGYPERPRLFPSSIGLIGLRDVRDYKIRSSVRPEQETLGTSSPFNVKVESLTLRNFTSEEVAELYAQHTRETGQVFAPEAVALAWELSRGQPWLVNALARQLVEVLVPDPTTAITPAHVDAAKEILILRRDTHLDSLVDRLREPRVRKVVEPILAGAHLADDVLADDVAFVKDLGLVASGRRGLEIANPIYREVIPRVLTSVIEESLDVARPSYVGSDGRLRFGQLLNDFCAFWCEHAESFLLKAPYSEAAAQLVFMAFLHKVVNGGGFVDREYAVGRGRIDLCVRWPWPGGVDRWAVELKVWRDADRTDPIERGLDQLADYLERLGLQEGTLIVFDARSQAPPLPERVNATEREHQGRWIRVLVL